MPDQASLCEGAQELSLTRSYWGVAVSFRSNSKALFDVLTRLLPSAVERSAHPQTQVAFSLIDRITSEGVSFCDFLVNGKRIYSDLPSDCYFHFIEQYLQEAVAILSSDFVFVHAGVVGWQGRAIILPGKSWSGKSTLVMALVEAGATFYSDEYAIFDRSARVHAFLRPPRVRDTSGRETANQISDRLITEIRIPKPLPVGLILLSSYSQNAIWGLRELTPGESVLGLIENALAIRRYPEVSLKVLKEVSLCARSYRADRGEAHVIASRVLESATQAGG